jgi:hypothetical protein
MDVEKSIRFLAVACALCCLVGGSAFAWEFSMEGEFVWKNRFVQQLGSNGFFGKYDQDNSSTGGNFASVNGWAGGKLDDLSSSAGVAEQRMEVNAVPELRINPAMRLRGEYRLGSYGDPVASAYVNSTSPGVQVAISEGQWTMWWFSAQTPLGMVVIGKRPFTFGCGLQYNGAEDLTTESLLVVAPYGPFRIGLGFYPWRRQPENSFRQDQPNNAFPNPPDNPYYNQGDFNALLAASPIAFLTYDSGPLSLGVVAEYFSYHRGPESQRLQADRASFPANDVVSADGGAFLKYNNGPFFFNAELDWVYRTTKFHRPLNGTFFGTPDRTDGRGSLFAPRYIEAWRWMAEAGFVLGPTKASFIFSRLPGPDRRNGVLIDRQPYFYGFGNYGLFGPYSLALDFYYGAGLDLFNLNTDGYMNDASIFGARLDYAVANNLNVYASFFRADRDSTSGYGWGFMRPAPTGSRVEFANLSTVNAVTADAPTIPDSNLGWEVDAGMDWQLLDKWTLRFIAAYWQPGKWFNYACIDKAVPNWDIPSASNRFGINPDRSIDAILAMKVKLIIQF